MSISTSSEQPREPAWDIARLFPDQGTWSAGDYLELTSSTNRLVEFNNGNIEVLAVPTEEHQLILQFLQFALRDFVAPRKLGTLVPAGLRVRTSSQTFREPDIVFMLTENRDRRNNNFWEGADLVMEVVSPDTRSRMRELVDKRIEYAAAGIPEYWIVDPETRSVTVLSLEDREYAEHGIFTEPDTATSVLLDGFSVSVQEVFAAADE
ncbi:MAG: Uma2 family endonuclease [Fuerstiella sp.]